MAGPVSVFSQMQMEDADMMPHFNTGTPFDIGAGRFLPGVNGEMLLSGGLATTNGTAARENRGKSTQQNGMLIRALARYAHSEGLIHDTEESQLKDRLTPMHGMHTDDPVAADKLSVDIESRWKLTSNGHGDLDWYNETLKEVADIRMKFAKELEVETPFLHPKTMKPMRILRPFFTGLDSLSKASVLSVQKVLDEHAAGDKKTQTIFAQEGLAKTKVVNQWPRLCRSAGIVLAATVHIGEKMMEDPYAPKNKDLPMMRHGETIKGAGAAFLYLVSNLFELRDSEPVIDKDKNPKYPFKQGSTGQMEFQRITAIVTRSKNAPAGTKIPYIMSQSEGLLSSLSSYDYLNEHDYGLIGNDRTHKAVMTDVPLTRTTIHEKLTDPKVARALEILYQICYIYNNWTWRKFPVPFDLDITKLPDMLAAQSIAVDDILTSRGYWTYRDEFTKNDLPPYLSAYDILSILTGNYKPKFLQARTVSNVVAIKAPPATSPLKKAA